MLWRLSHRFDSRALPLADRHYNRQHVGSPQFVPPGRCLVLLTEGVSLSANARDDLRSVAPSRAIADVMHHTRERWESDGKKPRSKKRGRS